MKLFNDWEKLLAKDAFQEDLIFLTIFIILLATGIIQENAFYKISIAIVTGDAIKKLGRGK